MNCYNHTGIPALGICKHCNKGVCRECLTDLGDGIACTTTCVDEVSVLNKLIEQNKKVHNSTIGSNNGSALYLMSLGMICLLTTAIWLKGFHPYLIGFGLVSLAFGIFILIRTRSLK